METERKNRRKTGFNCKVSSEKCIITNNIGQKNLTFFGIRGKISNPNRNFNPEFKFVSSFFSIIHSLFVRANLIVKKCVYLHISLDNKI